MTAFEFLGLLNDTLSGDATLIALVPAADITLYGSRAFKVDSIKLLYVGGSEQEELTQPFRVQFDFNLRDMDELAAAVARVRKLVSSPYLPITLGGRTFWAFATTPQPKPGSETEGYFSWMFDVRYELFLEPGEKYN